MSGTHVWRRDPLCAWLHNKEYLLSSIHCTVGLLLDLSINCHPRWDLLYSAVESSKNRTPLGALRSFFLKRLLALSGSLREKTRIIHE